MEETRTKLKDQYARNRKKVNWMFLLLAGMCCFYFISNSGWVIAAASIFILTIFYMFKKQESLRHEEFRKYHLIFYNQLQIFLNEKFSSQGWEKIACGYLEDIAGFQTVLLCACGTELWVGKMFYKKDFVYRINDDFWYLFTMRKEAGELLLRDKTASFVWEKSDLNHQEILREKAMKWNQLTIMEFYICNRLLPDMLRGIADGRIAMADGIDSLRRETIYMTKREGGTTIYLNEAAMKQLQLLPV